MDRKENSRKRTQSTQRKFGLSIVVIRQGGRWVSQHSNPLFYSLRSLCSFVAIHFERVAWRMMATAILGGVAPAALGAFPACREPRAQQDSRLYQSPITDYRLPITERLCGSELLP
jgi:hypothetical protein